MQATELESGTAGAVSADLKADVREFWNAASCGETGYAIGPDEAARLSAQAQARYSLEPYLEAFAGFGDGVGKDALEIGVGMGADHLRWARSHPATLTGVDLTERAIDFTGARLKLEGLQSRLEVADAENLPFEDDSFDIVYSWGVLHHSPDTERAFREVARVLRPGGSARIMIYNTWSLTGLMLWARYGLLTGRVTMPMQEVYSSFLESPGTKAYTPAEARGLCARAGLRDCHVSVQLNHGDLLQGAVGQRHQGGALTIAKALWPRWFFKTVTPFLGLYLLIEAKA